MKILAIESSCDETAAAILEGPGNYSELIQTNHSTQTNRLTQTAHNPQATNQLSSPSHPNTSNHSSNLENTEITPSDLHLLSNVVVSQIDIFAAYGGVIPEVTARSHLEVILPVIHQALLEAGITKYSTDFLAHNPTLQTKIPPHASLDNDIDAIAVTYAPGLLGSLLVGTLTTRTLAILWDKPLYAVHHLKSHLYANWLPTSSLSNLENIETTKEDNKVKTAATGNTSIIGLSAGWTGSEPREHQQIGEERSTESRVEVLPVAPIFPLLSLVISGGHTQIIYMPAHNQFEIIGTTRDDAVGECFDKVAKILGLPYPGGPSIAQCAKNGDPHAYKLPHPKIPNLDFSFSGLKTAVLRAVQKDCGLPITTPSYELQNFLSSIQKANFAASFQDTACDILLEKLENALQAHPEALSLVFAGGVSANQVLREKALKRFTNGLKTQISHKHNPKKHAKTTKILSNPTQTVKLPTLAAPRLFFPNPKFTGDNAAMVATAAYYEILSGVQSTNPYDLDITPRIDIH